jgi:hypothetical protein
MSSCDPEPSGNESIGSDGSALSELKSQLLLSILAARGTLSSSVGAVNLLYAALDGLQLHAAHICFEDSASAVHFVRCHKVGAQQSETVAELLAALSEELQLKSADKIAANEVPTQWMQASAQLFGQWPTTCLPRPAVVSLL